MVVKEICKKILLGSFAILLTAVFCIAVLVTLMFLI